MFEDAATVSIAYTLMKRCGLDIDGYLEHEYFLPVFKFNIADAIALLGTAVSEESEEIFREIAIAIIKTERERSEEYERNNLQGEGGLSDTRHRTDGAYGQQGAEFTRRIRQNEENMGFTTGNILEPACGRGHFLVCSQRVCKVLIYMLLN